MTQEQDIVERLRKPAFTVAELREATGLWEEAAQTIAALRAECDKQAKLAEACDYQIETLRAERDEMHRLQDVARNYCEDAFARAEAAERERDEARVKELEGQIAFDTRPSHIEINALKLRCDAAIRERDELEAERARLWNENRELRATIDVEKAVADSCLRERDEARKALDVVHTWAEQRCPCFNEQPNPCPLCGASVENLEACKSAENTMPRHVLEAIRSVRRARASSNREGGEE